jgi:hypothetical protein
MKRNVLFAAVVTMGTLLSACAAHGSYAVRYGPPPPPRYGMIGIAPGPGYVWAEGFYDLRGGAWIWVPGRWMAPPHPRARYVPGRWVRHGRDYRFHEGRWR